MPWQLIRLYNHLRCFAGIHRLKGYRDGGDGVNVVPIHPRSRPGPNDWRRCEWCGASWEGAYDGLEPFWRRIRR